MSSSTPSISALILHPVLQSTPVYSVFPSETTSPVIGTHDGSFHCDEALAIAMLKILPEYHLSPIVRTRKPEFLQQCHLVVDVGAEYIPEKHRYDHHQREFTGTLEGWKTRLSSAGLVYKHFGREIISEVLRRCEATDVTGSFIDICYKKVYQDFMEHIDAIDNGVEVADAPLKYRVSTTLSSRVGHLVPQWNEPNTPEAFNEGFLRAMALTGEEFIGVVERMAKYWWPARSIVQRALDDRLSRHSSGKIIVLDSQCPWKDHLFDIEKETDISGSVQYVLYEDTGGSWRIQAVPIDPSSFHSRKKLLEPFMGLRDDDLSEKTGIPGSIFVHASGFIGGHKTLEGAMAMAVKSLA